MSIVKKGTFEFAKARQAFFQQFAKAAEEDSDLPFPGTMGLNVHKLMAEIPLPFSCPNLEIILFESGSVAWFCGRIGCLCSPCREDFLGEYPDYCPDPNEPWLLEDDRYEEEDEYYECEEVL